MAEKSLFVKGAGALDDDSDQDAIDGPRTWLGKQCLLYSLKTFDFTTRLAGPLLFSLIWLLVGTVVYAYFKHYCPLIETDPLFSCSGLLRTLVVAYFTISVLYHHVQCAMTSPGYAAMEDIREQRFHRSYRVPGFCRFCRSRKPSRISLLFSHIGGERSSKGGAEEDHVAMIIVITVLFTSAAGAVEKVAFNYISSETFVLSQAACLFATGFTVGGASFTDKRDDWQDNASSSLGAVKNIRSVFHHHK
eukprot:jgi/Bigna1/133808/aug1.22_g8516